MDIYAKVKDAIVDISGFSPVLVDGIETPREQYGNGFFIDCENIVTTAHTVLLPPNITRVPPARYPNFGRNVINFVVVHNVNGTGKAYKYNFDIIGVDRRNDIAVIRIIPTCGSPQIKSQPYLQWGKSRKEKIGNKVGTIGDALTIDSRSFSTGVIRDNMYTSPTATSLLECVSSDVPVGPGNSGGPLLNESGKVIGVVFSYGFLDGVAPNFTVALSQYAAERVVGQILCPTHANFEIIEDPFGPFIRRIDTALFIIAFFVRPFSTLYEVGTTNVDLQSTTMFNQMIGVYVFNVLPESPLIGLVSDGDIITHVDGEEVGIYSKQVSLGTALLNRAPGDIVKIKYRKVSEGYCHLHKIKVTVGAIPIQFDVPHEGILRPAMS